MFWKKSKIYRADGQLQLHEIKWFRLKAGVSFVGSTALLVLALLVVNYYVYDFLGMGYRTIQSLKDENKALHAQLSEAAYVVLPGVGHVAFEEDPGSFIAALGEWLDQLVLA